MAVGLLIVIAAVLAWGTIYEARFGTAAVQQFIYHAWWFQAFLGFLALNLAIAALQRYPWQPRHAPFVLAHNGIILILFGGILGGRFGIEGQLVIPEGESVRTLRLPRKVLVVHEPNPGADHLLATNFEATAWVHEPQVSFHVPLAHRSIDLTVDRYFPNATVDEQISGNGKTDNPAIRLALSAGDQHDDIWLFARDPERFGAQWGDAHVLFLVPQTQEDAARFLKDSSSMESSRGMLSIAVPGEARPRELPVPQQVDQPIALAGTPYTVTVKDYFADFALTDTGPISRSDEPRNPAVAFLLSGPEGTDAHLLFANLPEFEQLHGLQHKIPIQMRYVHAGATRLPPQAISVLRLPDEGLAAVVTGNDGKRQVIQPLEVGKRYDHPSLGYQFTVATFYPSAEIHQQFTNRSNEVQREALHVVARDGSASAEAWLGTDEPVELLLGEHPIVVAYREAERELPLTVKLLDFRKIDYPGTQMASGFESDVELTDPQRGIILLRKISMNHPLRYRGYSFYQSSYIQGPVETTVLSVRNDPGTPFVYAGFLIVIAGVVTMFMMRRDERNTRNSRMNGTLMRLAAGAIVVVGATAIAAASTSMPHEALSTMRYLAIQHNGRLKPFDSFARETLETITGSPRRGNQDPVETVFTIIASPERWQGEPLIAVPFVPLREALGMERTATHISYNELIAMRKLMRMLPAIVTKQQRDEKLSMLENETMDAFQRFVALSNLLEHKLAFVPPPGTMAHEWLPIQQPSGYPPEQQTAIRSAWSTLMTALRSGPQETVTSASRQMAEVLQHLNPSAYAAPWRLRWEVLYNQVAPFRVARVIYLVSVVGFLLSLGGVRRTFAAGSLAALVAAFVIHSAGIISRVVLGGRPPVSNFYETMLWLPFVAVALALVFERIYRVSYFGLAAAAVAAITLVLADHLPLDSSISPVVAVLHSNLWLTIHVLTIVASYGALTLATALAHVYGGLYLGRDRDQSALRRLDTSLYRTLQVGVVLLATGIMLGAVWANASWGRYWGWDPKETWALITLLWFLAILHGRFAGWIHGVGVALATIGGFFLLLMTYYGVSFYLVGLHSYAGGHAKPVPPLLIAYLMAEFTFLAIVGGIALTRRRAA